MGKVNAHRWKQAGRRLARLFLFIFLGALLFGFSAGVYLNQVGIPNFLKKPLLKKLEKQGAQVEFARARWLWSGGIAAEQVQVTANKNGKSKTSGSGTLFSASAATLYFKVSPWVKPRIQVTSLIFKQADFKKAQQGSEPVLENLNGRFSFPAVNQIRVHSLKARYHGANLSLQGTITNFAALREWKFPRSPKKASSKKSSGLNRVATTLDKIRFATPPDLKVSVAGDARDLNSFKVEVLFDIPEAETPWGPARNLHLKAFLSEMMSAQPANQNGVQLTADSLATQWGQSTNFHLHLHSLIVNANKSLINGKLEVVAPGLQTPWGKASLGELHLQLGCSLSNLFLRNAGGSLHFTAPKTSWGEAGNLELQGQLHSSTPSPASKLEHPVVGQPWKLPDFWRLNWEAKAVDLISRKLSVKELACQGEWRSPELIIHGVQGNLYGGELKASGRFDRGTRLFTAQAFSSFDLQEAAPLLSSSARRWLSLYQWKKPPIIEASASGALPPGKFQESKWFKDFLAALKLKGNFSLESGSYRKVEVSAARSDFVYSNRVWTFPTMHILRPEGEMNIHLTSNERTGQFRFDLKSQVDPNAFRPVLQKSHHQVLDSLKLIKPPLVIGEITGLWGEEETLAFNAEVAAGNLHYRGADLNKLQGSLFYTNKVLTLTNMTLESGEKRIKAPLIKLDIDRKKVFLTNVYSTMDPMVVTRAIGRQIANAIKPYYFARPPTIVVSGVFSLHNVEEADLHFGITGEQFHWQWFNADEVSGTLDWVGETLSVTNLQARAYGGGRLAGWAFFDFAPPRTTHFRFDAAFADLDFYTFVSSVSATTNRLEGLLHGQLAITSANTRDWKSWQGHGRVNLRDGFIWEIPIFGVFTPMLNNVIPGAGKSRAREAAGTFTISNSLIHSKDLEIRASAVRMKYEGTVDFNKNLNARVEAEILRDAWVIGPAISLALTPLSKLFEYKVTGTLGKPKTEKLHLPNRNRSPASAKKKQPFGKSEDSSGRPLQKKPTKKNN